MKFVALASRMLLKAQCRAKQLLTREEGPTMTEYGLMVAVVALIAVAGAFILGTGLSTLFSNIGGVVGGAPVPTVP